MSCELIDNDGQNKPEKMISCVEEELVIVSLILHLLS